MNFLAHSVLSFSEAQLVGNMIADFIKNKDRANFPLDIQEGIKLHRAIDSFTDTHPNVSAAKKYFSPLVRLYAGAFVDVTFDYFVAMTMTDEALYQHSQKVYETLWKYENVLPENFKTMLIKMEKDNWLYNYKEDWGIKFSLQNVLQKAKYLEKDLPVFQIFLDHKKEIGKEFEDFFPDIKNYLKNYEY